MTTLDLRSMAQDDHQQRIFESIDETPVDEAVTVVSDHDIDVLLHRYQIKRGHRLQWETDHRDGDARRVRITKGGAFDEGECPEFDVREMPPQRRHEVLTETFDRLDPGEGFVLVNDHDPEPLYHELRSTRGEGFEWEYITREAAAWRVEMVKTAATDSPDDDVATFDVRDIPKQEWHPTIHHRYENIADGEPVDIIAPHERQPLHREFRERYGESFTWEVVESESGRCRVRITKPGGDGDTSAGTAPTASPGNSVDITDELDGIHLVQPGPLKLTPPVRCHGR